MPARPRNNQHQLRFPVDGTQHLSDHFLKQVRFRGIQPGFAFAAQPETNRVAERCNHTLKEQVVSARVFQNIHDVRLAVAALITRYNQQWLVVTMGYRSPAQARREYFQAIAA
jgi:putative transposase